MSGRFECAFRTDLHLAAEAYVDNCFQPCFGVITVCQLGDILHYLSNEEEHEEQV